MRNFHFGTFISVAKQKKILAVDARTACQNYFSRKMERIYQRREACAVFRSFSSKSLLRSVSRSFGFDKLASCLFAPNFLKWPSHRYTWTERSNPRRWKREKFSLFHFHFNSVMSAIYRTYFDEISYNSNVDLNYPLAGLEKKFYSRYCDYLIKNIEIESQGRCSGQNENIILNCWSWFMGS